MKNKYPLQQILILGDSEITGYGTIKPRNIISSILGQTPVKSKSLAISNPHDFRQVNSIDLCTIYNNSYKKKLLGVRYY